MKKVLFATSVAASVFLTGCASILTDDTQTVNVLTSNGEEAQVKIDGQSFDVPGVAMIKKDGAKTKIMNSSTEGCVSTTALNREVEPTFFINILSGGAFGSSTDYGTDKMWKYEDSIVLNCKD